MLSAGRNMTRPISTGEKELVLFSCVVEREKRLRACKPWWATARVLQRLQLNSIFSLTNNNECAESSFWTLNAALLCSMSGGGDIPQVLLLTPKGCLRPLLSCSSCTERMSLANSMTDKKMHFQSHLKFWRIRLLHVLWRLKMIFNSYYSENLGYVFGLQVVIISRLYLSYSFLACCSTRPVSWHFPRASSQWLFLFLF